MLAKKRAEVTLSNLFARPLLAECARGLEGAPKAVVPSIKVRYFIATASNGHGIVSYYNGNAWFDLQTWKRV